MKQILLVHDTQEDPAPRKDYLESVGYDVTLCNGGNETLELLQRSRFQALVMDVLLRGPNGFEVARRVRKVYHVKELPIVLCSAIYRKPVFHEEALAVGAQRLLLKPFDPDDLAQLLHALIG